MADLTESPPTPGPGESSGLSGLQKFLIALSPTVFAAVLTGFSTKLKIDSQVIPFALGLIGFGAILAGVFVVKGMKKSNIDSNPVVMVLAFLGVFVGYCAVGLFGGCLVAVGISAAVSA